tara:strand:+ start:429 stop:689 length:261 start_codon:yes stop_codon:yes gene_type:complete
MEKEFEWINDFSKPWLQVWLVTGNDAHDISVEPKVYLATPHEGHARKVKSFLMARGIKARMKLRHVAQQKKKLITQEAEHDITNTE